MDTWKSRGGKSQRREEKRRGEERREEKESEERRCRMQAREKVEKAWNTVLFQWFVAKEGWKVGSLKRRMRSHLRPDERWTMARHCGAKHISKSKHVSLGTLLKAEMSKKCTRCGQKRISKSKCAKHTSSGPLLEVELKLTCRKSARRCGAKHISKSKRTKPTSSGPFLEVEMSKKCTRCGQKRISKSKCAKHTSSGPLLEVELKLTCRKSASRCGGKDKMFGPLLDVQMSFRLAGTRDSAPCQKWAKREGFEMFWAISKNNGRRGAFEEDLDRCISRGRRSTADTWGTGKRETVDDLASLSRGRCNTLHRWNGKIAKRNGIIPSALHSTFHFWGESRRIASFLILPTSKIEDVSQNCFDFDVINVKN